MEWEEYNKCYKIEEYTKCMTKEERNEAEKYVRSFYEENLPVIFSLEHFGILTENDVEFIERVCCNSAQYYKRLEIPKRNGGLRAIAAPVKRLKRLQRWINDNILAKRYVSPFAKAYMKKRSVKDNACFHIGQKKLLCMDLEDFFPSIKKKQIVTVFIKAGYREDIANILTSICCLDGALPQGAPTSPALSNIIASKMDRRIADYVESLKIRYTRYADDLAFSGEFNPVRLVKGITRIANRYGFVVNSEKTKIKLPHQCQEVTGIAVNEKMQVLRKKRRELRQKVYYIKRFGADSQAQRAEDETLHYLRSLLGSISYAVYINPKDKELENYRLYIKEQIKIYEKKKYNRKT